MSSTFKTINRQLKFRNMERGKRVFTTMVYKRLRELISQLEKADRQKSKSIRTNLRNIGLYWSEVADGVAYTVANLDRLFTIGTLKLSDGDKTKENQVKTHSEIETTVIRKQVTYYENNINEIDKKLISTPFFTINELEAGRKVPDSPGIYCIKMRKGVLFPKDYGKIREDGIIYIGKAESSLKTRLWEQELNHKGHATFFRSIGAMLGKRPPKGSLYGKDSRKYEFDYMDIEFIKKWMSQSLLINFIILPIEKIKDIEDKLIKKYCPLVNIKGNPQKSKVLEAVRKECVEIAQSKP